MEATHLQPGIGTQRTVNELIRTHPGTVEVFNRFGIDSCCGGAAPVGEAAARDGADPVALLAALDEVIGRGSTGDTRKPSIDRPLAGPALLFRLNEEGRSDLIDQHLLAKAGRSARTLVKDGPLRVTVVSLAAGGSLTPHRADGPITVHVLSGTIRFRAAGSEWQLQAGDLLSLGAGEEHAVDSREGGVFLLTVATGQ